MNPDPLERKRNLMRTEMQDTSTKKERNLLEYEVSPADFISISLLKHAVFRYGVPICNKATGNFWT
jgi:hypothetical protein